MGRSVTDLITATKVLLHENVRELDYKVPYVPLKEDEFEVGDKKLKVGYFKMNSKISGMN